MRTEADVGAHQQAFAALLDAAGFPRETITHAVATHYDGVGMLAWRNDDGSWCRFFPNAPVLISARELAAIDISNRLDDSCVQPTGDRHPITSEVTLEHTGAHTPGHQIVRIESEGERAVIVGHLAVVPHHLSSGVIPKQHVDAEAAWTTLCALRDEDTVLIGPLWPTPGAGRWQNGELVPV